MKFQMNTLGSEGMRDGDVILCNHPKAGGSHLPDLTVITPVCCCHLVVVTYKQFRCTIKTQRNPCSFVPIVAIMQKLVELCQVPCLHIQLGLIKKVFVGAILCDNILQVRYL